VPRSLVSYTWKLRKLWKIEIERRINVNERSILFLHLFIKINIRGIVRKGVKVVRYLGPKTQPPHQLKSLEFMAVRIINERITEITSILYFFDIK
jgi:hypothetical protein